MVFRLNCTNSVDKSTVLMVECIWFRLVGSNRMMVRGGEGRFAKKHMGSLKPEDVEKFLVRILIGLSQELTQVQNLLQTTVNLDQIRKWVNGILYEEWGLVRAARVWNIITTGWDSEVKYEQKQGVDNKPAECFHKNIKQVPGVDVMDNGIYTLYGITQVLSWIACQNNSINQQLEKIMDIQFLVAQLTNRNYP